MTIKEKFFYNFISSVLPMIFAIFLIPILIQSIGIERFGMLTIIWMIIGYFGLLDMGLGRSLTQKVASRIGASNLTNLRLLIFIITAILFIFGILMGVSVYFFSQDLIINILNISKIYQKEIILGIPWLSLSIPLVLVSTALLGVLEGQQDFKAVSLVRAPLGIMMLIFPLIIIQFHNSLEWILASLFLARLIIFLILIILIISKTKNYIGNKIDKEELISVFKFSGWVFVSNLVSPIMVYFDRFYIASILSVSILAFYTTPLDVLVKILVVPFALVSVMFSSFSTYWNNDNDLVINYFKKSLLTISALMLPIVVIIYVFSFNLMSIWIGYDFALKSYEIVKILSIGIFFNALSMIPYAFIESIGRSDITAKIRLLELPFYIILLYILIEKYTLVGAAFAWTIRTFFDAIILYYISRKQFKIIKVSE